MTRRPKNERLFAWRYGLTCGDWVRRRAVGCVLRFCWSGWHSRLHGCLDFRTIAIGIGVQRIAYEEPRIDHNHNHHHCTADHDDGQDHLRHRPPPSVVLPQPNPRLAASQQASSNPAFLSPLEHPVAHAFTAHPHPPRPQTPNPRPSSLSLRLFHGNTPSQRVRSAAGRANFRRSTVSWKRNRRREGIGGHTTQPARSQCGWLLLVVGLVFSGVLGFDVGCCFGGWRVGS